MFEHEYCLRVIPLGGVTNVTMNMYVYELYRGDALQDIILIDCGIGFPKEKDLGVDLVIPDITYLQDKKDKIRAILLTHGHEDHISALKFHYEALGRPPVYGSKLTAHFVQSQFEERKIALKVQQIEYNKYYTFGGFSAYYIHVTHSIPDTTHIVVKSPLGVIYHGSDYKLDLNPPYGSPPDFYAINKAGQEGVLCLLTDCLGVERAGTSLSESAVGQTFEDAIRTTRGAFVMSTFSSNISRIHQCVEAAIKFNRKICFLGRSMRQNTDLAKKIGYLPNAISKLQIREKDIAKHKPSNICVICTGSQGQANSALARIAEKEHRFVRIAKGDKVLFSSDPIPGNEDGVFEIIEKLYQQGAEVIYSSIQGDLHASGHANREEMKYLLRFIKPKYIVPIGGTPRHQRRYREMAEGMGWAAEQVFGMHNGDTLWFKGGKVYKGDPVEVKSIYIDSYGAEDVKSTILRDRKMLSQEGIIFTIVPITQQLQILKSPEFRTRGFTYQGDEKDLFKKASDIISKHLKLDSSGDDAYILLKRKIILQLETFFFKESGRRPLIVVELVIV